MFGDGLQVRGNTYIGDCVEATAAAVQALPGETYNVGGWNEKPNIEIVKTVCALLDELRPRADGQPYASQITYVTDRPGHDRRYALDSARIHALGWRPTHGFRAALAATVEWYRTHEAWWEPIKSGAFRAYYASQYSSR